MNSQQMQTPDLFLVVTLILSAIIILYAYKNKKIDLSAAAASGIIGGVTILTTGIQWLYLILAFFVAGNLITKYRYSVKENLGVAEGTRTFRNVFGNGGAAAVFAIFYMIMGRNPVLLLGFLGAIATATADTFATEIGEAHDRKPRLIVNLRRTEVGTSGAISLPGSVGALVGASVISLIPFLFSMNPDKGVVFIAGTVSGFMGCHIDSLIGATIEGDRLDKHITNFFGTLSGGILAILIYLIF